MDCNSVNSGVLANGITYFIHDLKNVYENMVDDYLINIHNVTYVKTILKNEQYDSYPFIYLKYIAIFFDFFNDSLINLYLDYLKQLSKLSIVLIVFFILFLLIGIYFIVKFFKQDIKNARGIICVIPSKYLKRN